MKSNGPCAEDEIHKGWSRTLYSGHEIFSSSRVFLEYASLFWQHGAARVHCITLEWPGHSCPYSISYGPELRKGIKKKKGEEKCFYFILCI